MPLPSLQQLDDVSAEKLSVELVLADNYEPQPEAFANSEDDRVAETEEKDSKTTSAAAAKNNDSPPNAHVRDPIFPLWSRCTQSLHRSISKIVTICALHAVKYPKSYIVIITLLSFTLAAVGFFTSFELELDLATVFTPVDSLPQRHGNWIASSEGFPDQTRTVQLVFHNHGDNVLHVSQAQRVMKAIATIRTTPGYDELCSLGSYVNFQNEKTCRIMSISNYWGHNATLFEQQVGDSDHASLRKALSQSQYLDGSPVFRDAIVGNYAKDDSGMLSEAQAYLVMLYLPDIEGTTEPFEASMLERLDDLRRHWIDLDADTTSDSEYSLVMDMMTLYAYELEAIRAIFSDLYLVAVCMVLMVGFTCLIFYRKDKVQSRCLLGVASIVTIAMSMLSGLGLMFLCRVPYSVLHQMLPFVALGIGLDDTFIITGAYFRTNPKHTIEERIRQTMEHVGWSISVTTITTVFAFVLGYASSTFPGVHWLCLYAVTIISIDFFYQITYFVAWVVLDERRIAANRRDCCLWITVEVDDTEEEIDSRNVTDGEIDSQNEISLESDGAGSSKSLVDRDGALSAQKPSDIFRDQSDKEWKSRKDDEKTIPDPFQDRIMRWYANALMKKPVKIVVLVFFSLFFAANCYSASLMHQEFNVADYVPKDSYLKNVFDSLDQYCSVVRPMAVYFRNVNQSDPGIQKQMVQYVDELESLHQIGSSGISLTDLAATSSGGTSLDVASDQIRPFCWVRDFQELFEQYTANVTDPVILQALDEMTFLERLDLALADPTIREIYGQDIVRDEETGDILASRCYLFLRNIDLKNVEEQIEMLADQREVASVQPINQDKNDWSFFAWDEMFFYWEAYAVAVKELIFTIIAGVVAVTVISFVFMPNYTATLIICPMILVLYIDLLGTFRAIGLNINGLTYVCVVVSIGLLVGKC